MPYAEMHARSITNTVGVTANNRGCYSPARPIHIAMAWYRRDDNEDELGAEKRSVPVGVFTKCPGCRAALLTADLEKTAQVCPHCEHHFAMTAVARLQLLLDPDGIEDEDTTIESVDPLGFKDSKRYAERLRAARRGGGQTDAIRCASGQIEGQPVEIGVFVFEFMGGSMGSVVGEKITRVFERALARRRTAIICSASGGARMQEGVLSLMQMAKTSAALGRLREAGLPYISVLLQSDDRRRGRQLRDARRRDRGRAQGADRLRRRARHPEHHPAASAAGLPARRVPAGPRLPRQDHQAQRDARDAGEPDSLPGSARRSVSASAMAAVGYPALLARLDGLRSLGVDFGLERVRRALGALGSPEQRLPAVQIAGTNGKGSTAAMTEAILRAAGWRTGLYTSPHLCRFTERIRVAGVEVDGDRLARLDAAVAATGVPLTYFEVATVLAFQIMAEERVELAVLETGLGGRLDAVTACAPLATAITSIGWDHMEFLGTTLAAIAREKAGILKPGVPCFLARVPPEADAAIDEVARAVGAPVSAPRARASTLDAGSAGAGARGRAPAIQRGDRRRAGARGRAAAGEGAAGGGDRRGAHRRALAGAARARGDAGRRGAARLRAQPRGRRGAGGGAAGDSDGARRAARGAGDLGRRGKGSRRRAAAAACRCFPK